MTVTPPISQSPLPQKEAGSKLVAQMLSFPQAINAIIGGKSVRRKEWSDADEYGVLRDSFLMIHRAGKFHTWIVSEGDMLAIDWIII